MADVTFLGTGGAFSAGRRSNVAVLVEQNGFRMLVECGPVIMQQLARADLKATDIEHLFISHAHGDHILGLPMLALSRINAPTPLNVYAGSNTLTTLQVLGPLSFSSLKLQCLNFQWHELSEEGTNGMEVAPGIDLHTAVLNHPPGVPTLAARWDFEGGPSITFVTDTRPSEAAVELARGSDFLIHEASFSAVLQPNEDAAVHYHSTAQQAGEIARRADCPRLALVHLGLEIGDHPEVLAEEARAGTDLEVIVPADGELISV
jgi:ribonuclease Z